MYKEWYNFQLLLEGKHSAFPCIFKFNVKNTLKTLSKKRTNAMIPKCKQTNKIIPLKSTEMAFTNCFKVFEASNALNMSARLEAQCSLLVHIVDYGTEEAKKFIGECIKRETNYEINITNKLYHSMYTAGWVAKKKMKGKNSKKRYEIKEKWHHFQVEDPVKISSDEKVSIFITIISLRFL